MYNSVDERERDERYKCSVHAKTFFEGRFVTVSKCVLTFYFSVNFILSAPVYMYVRN